MADRSVILSKEEIGRAVTQGPKRVTGSEYRSVCEDVSRELGEIENIDTER